MGNKIRQKRDSEISFPTSRQHDFAHSDDYNELGE